MVDPVVGGISGAVAQGAVDYIRNYIEESDDSEQAWKKAARECVIQSRVSFRQTYRETKAPDRSELKQELGEIGRSSRELAVRGEVRGYDESVIALTRELATVCADYSGAPSYPGGGAEDELETRLSRLGSELIDETE